MFQAIEEKRCAQRSLLQTMLILAGASFSILAIALLMLYNNHLSGITGQLVVAAKNQAHLIEAAARFDTEHSKQFSHEYNTSDEYAFSRVIATHGSYFGIGSTGELVLAKLEGDSIVFQQSYRNTQMDHPATIAAVSNLAEPMRRALRGESGVMRGRDHHDIEVIAAYEPIADLAMGIVAKIDMTEVRTPFNHAILISLSFSLLVVLGGGYLIVRSTKPLTASIRRRASQLEAEIIVRKNLEAELRESEMRLRTMFDNIGEGIIVADPQENFIFANQVAEEIFGSLPGDLIGRNFREFVSEEQYNEILTETSKRRKGSRTQYEIELKRHDGRKRRILVTATPELDDNGKLVAEFGIFRDVTGVRESEALLRWLNKAVESSNEIIFMTDRNGIFIYANPAFSRLYGYKAHEVIGECTPRILKSDEQDPDFYSLFWKSVLSGKRIEGEIVNKTSSGKLVTIAQSVNAVRNEKGEVEAFLAVQRDITEQKLAEYQLMEYTQEVESLVGKEQELTAELKLSLEELEKSKAETEEALQELKVAQTAMVQSEKMASIGVLAAGIAHEINNPVGYVANNLRELQNYTLKIQEYLKNISRLEKSIATEDIQSALKQQQELEETRKLHKFDFIIEDLSDLISDSLQGTSNIETIVKSLKLFSRKDEDAMIPLDLREIIDNSIRVVNNQVKYRAEVLVEADSVPEIMGQVGGLQQVFSNLLVNAAQAIEENGRITIRILRSGSTVVTQIEDTGCGIAPESLGRIFEPFYTTKDVGEGTGLGLSIVFDIIKKHKGRIEVKSELGKGTVFTIHLPIAQVCASTECGETP